MDIQSTVFVVEGQQWEKDLPDLGDLELLVAPWSNAVFEREMQKLVTALPPAQRPDGRVVSSAFYVCTGKAIAKTILFGWKNFTDGGIEKPFDAAYAETILIDPRFRTFHDGVIAAARRVQTGVTADEAAVLGNSNASSSGGETGGAIKTS